MKTTSLLSRAALAVLLAGGIVAPIGQAALIIGTFGEWDGSEVIGTWGPASSHTPTYGQTFTVNDPSATTLAKVRFKLDYTSGVPLTFEAYVYEWSPGGLSGNVVGPRLDFSSPMGIQPDNGFQTVEVSTGNVVLDLGVEYMVFLSTVGYDLSNSGDGVNWGYLQAGAQDEPQKSVAGRFGYNYGAIESNWSDPDYWLLPGGSQGVDDLAFELVLVPEPQMVGVITALGLLGFGWLRRRGVR